MSLKQSELSKSGLAIDQLQPPSPVKHQKIVQFGPLTKKLCCLILTHPKSTVRGISDNFGIWPPTYLQ